MARPITGTQDVQTVRTPLALPLESRDGTLNKGALITNGFVEKFGEGARIYKRAGMTQLITGTAATGKGMASFIDGNGQEHLYVVQETGFNTRTVTPDSTTYTVMSAPSLDINEQPTAYFVFRDKIWAVGGLGNDGVNWLGGQSFYKSTIGGSWTRAATNLFGGTTVGSMRQGVIVNGDAVYLIGGNLPQSDATCFDDVWRSYDGINWTAITTSAAFGALSQIRCALLNGVMYVIGGSSDSQNTWTNSIYSSTDGITWTLVTSSPSWGGTLSSTIRKHYSVTAYAGKLWLIGGNVNGTLKSDVWYSTDGATWTEATSDAGWTGRQASFVTTIGGKLFFGGGGNLSTTWYYDTYTSIDGVTWTNAGTINNTTVPYPGTTYNVPCFTFSDKTFIPAANLSSGVSTGYPTSSTTSISNIYTAVLLENDFADFASDYLHSQVMIKVTNSAFKLDPLTSGVTQITDVDYPAQTVRGCVYLDGTFYVMDQNGTIYGSDLDDCTSWDATNYISAEFDPDSGVFLGKQGQYVVAFGSQSTQFFWDAGNPTGSPLSNVQSGAFSVGCAHGNSAQQLEDTIIWMAQSKAVGTSHQFGRFVAILTSNNYYKKVSTPDVDRILNADDLATVYSFTLNEKGHTFYGLLLGTSGVTLVYDITADFWYVWTRSTADSAISISSLTQSNGVATATSTAHGYADGDELVVSGATPSGYNGTVNITYVDADTFTYPVSSSLTSPATGTITAVGSSESYFDMVASCNYNGQTVYQDESGGIIWAMDESNTQDNSVSINFKVRTSNFTLGSNKNKFCVQACYVGEVNSSTDVGLLRYTNDDFATYSDYRQVDLTSDFANLNALGKFRKRAWEWRHTRAQKHFIDSLELDIKEGIH